MRSSGDRAWARRYHRCVQPALRATMPGARYCPRHSPGGNSTWACACRPSMAYNGGCRSFSKKYDRQRSGGRWGAPTASEHKAARDTRRTAPPPGFPTGSHCHRAVVGLPSGGGWVLSWNDEHRHRLFQMLHRRAGEHPGRRDRGCGRRRRRWLSGCIWRPGTGRC